MQAVVGFLSAMARVLDLVDVQCKVMSAVQAYLRNPVIQAEREVSNWISEDSHHVKNTDSHCKSLCCYQELFLNALTRPIPRVVYDSVVKCHDIDKLLDTLEERQRVRSLVKAGHVPQYIEPYPQIKNVSRNKFKLSKF